MPPGVDVVGHGRPDIFFSKKKITGGFNGRGATCEPGNERMRRTGWPDKKKKKIFLNFL